MQSRRWSWGLGAVATSTVNDLKPTRESRYTGSPPPYPFDWHVQIPPHSLILNYLQRDCILDRGYRHFVAVETEIKQESSLGQNIGSRLT